MTAARRAGNLGPGHTPRSVLVPTNRPGECFEKRGPSTSAVEFGRALVQGRATASAGVNSLAVEFIVFSRACWLGSFLAEDTELLRR